MKDFQNGGGGGCRGSQAFRLKAGLQTGGRLRAASRALGVIQGSGRKGNYAEAKRGLGCASLRPVFGWRSDIAA